MSDEALEALLGDRRLIRHWGKLKSVRDNAAAMIGVAEEHGSFGAWLADWPGTNIVELWETLAKRFSQMGGNSGPELSAHGRQGHLHPDPLGYCGAEALGRGRRPAEEPQGPRRSPVATSTPGPPKPAGRSVSSA